MLMNGNSDEFFRKIFIEILVCVMGFLFKVNEMGIFLFFVILNNMV